MELIVLFLLIGGCSGLLAGLLGIGGGVITVPALYSIFLWEGYPVFEMMQTAIATSLASITITTAASSWTHYRKGAILYNVLGFLIPGLIVGCISGAQLVHLLPSSLLRVIFGSMSFLIGLYFFIPSLPIPKIAKSPNPLLIAFGLFIGHLSSLLGVGGGIFTVPLLFAYHLPQANIAATSSVATMATALVGTLTYLMLGSEMSASFSTLAYINIKAFLCISIGSLVSIRWGARLAHTLPTSMIKRIFGIILCATGFLMIVH
jgi:uncharacterized membrane protein YfcA